MYSLLVIFILIAAVLLTIVVLIQNSKGGGLSSSFSSSNQIMGVRRTTDFLEKATWGLAAFIVVVSISMAYVLPRDSARNNSIISEQAQQEEAVNPLLNTSGFAAPQAEETTNSSDSLGN
ncbi:MAG: preprotein translocase subunit SecG [Mediterranea sp.]|jgi:preprotein translocase subunit SecG|nr:preprotein translocase subunit SecG [Mediterranea sp.]